MPMKLEEIYKAIEAIAPVQTQEEWDNSGPQLSLPTAPIQRVLVCLEITDEVIDEAEEKQADLIITHHPLIFGGLSSIDTETVTGANIIRLINAGISVYAAHTPFDKAAGGLNDDLAERIGLRDIGSVAETLGRVGRLAESKPFEQLTREIKQKLELGDIRFVGDPSTMIHTVGICAGAGSELADLARQNGCQLYITGDLKYHDAQNAKATGLCVIDAGHYGTEKFFAGCFAKRLTEQTKGQIEIFQSQINIDPFDSSI